MKLHSYATMAALVLAGAAHGQNTLDWASTSTWSDGMVTGSYNELSDAGSANASIKPLTYDFGNGLLATVTAGLSGGAGWQNGTSVVGYAGWAPRANNDLFAFGIQNGSATTGANLVLTFNQSVTLNSFTIGDIDSGGTVRDLVNVVSNGTGPLAVIGAAPTAPTYSTSGNVGSFVGLTANEESFSTSAPTAWATLSSGQTTLTQLTISLLNGTGNHGIWISDISVGTPIPEPSTYALVLGVGTLALVVVRRRFVRRT